MTHQMDSDLSNSQVFERTSFILGRVRGKRVLHLGCADHDLFDVKTSQSRWLHSLLAENASSVVGVDIFEDQVNRMRERGYQVYHGDVEKLAELDLHPEFDVIVAGEIIEHLRNPGLFLDGVKGLFSFGTRMIVTTPNCFSWVRIPHTFKRTEECREDHVSWYSVKTLYQLLVLSGFEVDEIHFYTYFPSHAGGWRGCLHRVLRRVSLLFMEGLIFVAHPREGTG
jgi:2-polyprenyl-3-methyl-5-hydroxy-6-metoxy-1,4-benzoquinol methylase